MKKRLFVALLAASLAFGLLGGCGDSEPTEGRIQSGSDPGTEDNAGNKSDSNAEDGAGDSAGSGTEDSVGSGTEDSAGSGMEDSAGNGAGSGTKDSAGNGAENGSGSEDGYVIPDVPMATFEIPDKEVFTFIRGMKIGWNLGNTFDAFSDRTFANELDSETQWVGVATTREMIDDLKEAGFNAIRVPVSWHGHVDGDYQISTVWLDRVQEVVDYICDNDMYVILNIHHDNSEKFMYPATQYLEQSVTYVTTIWKQLAERFADYDEHMIFESMNEPRQVGTAWEWWINGSAECNDAIACINEINQAFVDTVRATGGNNGSRYLMVPGYDASPDGVLNEGFVIPTDAKGVTDKIILSVHAYTPYNFALQGPNEGGSTASFDSDALASTRDITYFMNNLYERFIKNGIPVVIDEFGARDKGGNIQDRIDYATYYVAAARARGMSCFWWDNNAFSGEGELFGLYNRRDCSFPYPEIVTGLMKYAD